MGHAKRILAQSDITVTVEPPAGLVSGSAVQSLFVSKALSGAAGQSADSYSELRGEAVLGWITKANFFLPAEPQAQFEKDRKGERIYSPLDFTDRITLQEIWD